MFVPLKVVILQKFQGEGSELSVPLILNRRIKLISHLIFFVTFLYAEEYICVIYLCLSFFSKKCTVLYVLYR